MIPVSDWFLLTLMIFTTFRITWLIVRDDFPPIARVRNWITTQYWKHRNPVYEYYDEVGDTVRETKGLRHWAKELITCPWCVSVWASAFVVLLVDVLSDPGLGQPWLWFGAVAGFSALMAQLTARLIDRE